MEDQEIYEIKTKVDVMEALLKQSNSILKAILGSIVSAGIIIGGFIYNYTATNTIQHTSLKALIVNHKNYTHNINDNVIKPNQVRSKENAIHLHKVDSVNYVQDRRLITLEKINKI